MVIPEAKVSPNTWGSWAWLRVTAQPRDLTNSYASLTP